MYRMYHYTIHTINRVEIERKGREQEDQKLVRGKRQKMKKWINQSIRQVLSMHKSWCKQPPPPPFSQDELHGMTIEQLIEIPSWFKEENVEVVVKQYCLYNTKNDHFSSWHNPNCGGSGFQFLNNICNRYLSHCITPSLPPKDMLCNVSVCTDQMHLCCVASPPCTQYYYQAISNWLVGA